MKNKTLVLPLLPPAVIVQNYLYDFYDPLLQKIESLGMPLHFRFTKSPSKAIELIPEGAFPSLLITGHTFSDENLTGDDIAMKVREKNPLTIFCMVSSRGSDHPERFAKVFDAHSIGRGRIISIVQAIQEFGPDLLPKNRASFFASLREFIHS